jgi:hypothetical protein
MLLIWYKILPLVSKSNYYSFVDRKKLSATGLKEETAPSRIS